MLSFSLGRCRLELSFSCFALLAFCCLFAGFSGSAFLLLAVCLHESAHLAVLFFFRSPPKLARISALGCRIVLDPAKPLNCRKSTFVSLAGPAVNLFSFGCMALLEMYGHPFAIGSLALGLFHSLPIEPLDGGMALRSFLSGHMETEKAEKIVFGISLFFLIPLSVLGFLILLRTRYNFSLLALSLYLMLYLVLKRDLFTQ